MNESGGMEKPNVGEGRDRIEHGQSDIRTCTLIHCYIAWKISCTDYNICTSVISHVSLRSTDELSICVT